MPRLINRKKQREAEGTNVACVNHKDLTYKEKQVPADLPHFPTLASLCKTASYTLGELQLLLVDFSWSKFCRHPTAFQYYCVPAATQMLLGYHQEF